MIDLHVDPHVHASFVDHVPVVGFGADDSCVAFSGTLPVEVPIEEEVFLGDWGTW